MNYKQNEIKNLLASGKRALGTIIQMASPEIVEAAGYAGYDFVFIDGEHGSFSFDTAVHMLRAAEAAGLVALMRVPDKTPSHIVQALDAGFMGVVVPTVNTKEEMETIVQTARYSPLGKRGACPRLRATRHQTTNLAEFFQWSNENTLIWPLIETLEGFENYSQIIEVPGIDAIYLGPTDLSQAMGLPGGNWHPDVVAKLEQMYSMAASNNIDTIGLVSGTVDEMQKQAQHWLNFGCKMIITTSDRKIVMDGFSSVVKGMKSIL